MIVEDSTVHELIYRFLLEAGFTRASLVSLSDPVAAYPNTVSIAQPLAPLTAPADAPALQEPTQSSVDSTEKYRRFFRASTAVATTEHSLEKPPPQTPVFETQPAYLVIDPENADMLAVIAVSEGLSDDELSRQQRSAVEYVTQSGDEHTQIYLIQLLSDSDSDADRVRFYHAASSDQIRQLSAYAFPDLDSLRAYRVRALVNKSRQSTQSHIQPAPESVTTYSAGGVYFLAVLLLLLGVGDWWWQQQHGMGLFSVVQTLLLVGSSVLIAAPTLLRLYRHSGKHR
ncbi:MAG: hypothetical protein KTR32_41475 [Granulosicoccus sp.]|nr:hypothetical protein [Granulosicoccus sp.]